MQLLPVCSHTSSIQSFAFMLFFNHTFAFQEIMLISYQPSIYKKQLCVAQCSSPAPCRNRERGRADSGHPSSQTSTALIRSIITQGNGMPGEKKREGWRRQREEWESRGGGGSCFRMAVLKNRPPPSNTHLVTVPCDLPGDQNTAAVPPTPPLVNRPLGTTKLAAAVHFLVSFCQTCQEFCAKKIEL